MNLRKMPLLRDPLLHFALLGGLLFAVDGVFNGDGRDAEEIVITPSRTQHLAAVFERSWQRPPDGEEMQRLVENFVREEVLYREALKLGLESDDTVIRRRLRLKMEFLARDLVDAVEPEPEVLKQFFRDHAERYRTPARISFRQIYFNRDQRQAPAQDARDLLAGLVNDAEAVGDPHLLPREFEQASLEEVNKQLGAGFAEQLTHQPQGHWVGPISSEYGEHLVFIDEYLPETTAEFAGVRSQVLRDWQAQQHTDMLERQYRLLRQGYRVRIETETGNQDIGEAKTSKEVAAR